MGIDVLPEHARNSDILTGNDLGKLGGLHKLPTAKEIEEFTPKETDIITCHKKAKAYISKGELKNAWLILLQI